jgi:hypothetical protein
MAVAPAHVGLRTRVMTIHRILQNSAFEPEEIDILERAYEDALRVLQLVDPTDPATEIVAEKLVKTFRSGVRDSETIYALALQNLGIRA